MVLEFEADTLAQLRITRNACIMRPMKSNEVPPMRPADMSPKELLLAAAQAYNLTYLQWVRESYPSSEGLLLPNRMVFNPIRQPEQAMWLSLELRMSQRHENNTVVVDAPWAGIEPQLVPYDGEPMRALCLAIVRAAAAVAAQGLSVQNIPA